MLLTKYKKYSMIISRKEAKRIGGRKMRAYIQDNGIEKDLKKGTLYQI